MDISTFGVARILANSIPGSAAKRAEDAAAAAESAAELLQPPATGSDVGKALIAKTVENGKVIEYEYGEAGGGSVTDVRVNGTSVVQDGVANLPKASTSDFGVVRLANPATSGLSLYNQNLIVSCAGGSTVKNGFSDVASIVPAHQHESAFYGLAKAAGVDMKNISSTTVGVYPEAQKSAISQMLNAPETVTGTTPNITALAGVHYICGEVSTVTITPPSSGIVDVRFTSGSTPAVMTVVPPTGMTISWPEWFDPDNLDADTVYEISIEDGEYAAVMSWT